MNNDFNTDDCNGHGTHVSGTVGSTTYGVAKKVTLHALRVVDCVGPVPSRTRLRRSTMWLRAKTSGRPW